MSLTKDDKEAIAEMIATGIAGAIAAANDDGSKIDEKPKVRPKTTFDERRKAAAESKASHDAKAGVQTVEGNNAIMVELAELRAQKNAREPADPRSPN